MPGVDFVISALFETSGFRSDGDCARAALEMKTTTIALKKTMITFTPRIVLCRAEGESVKHTVHSLASFAFPSLSVSRSADPGSSFVLFQFGEQLLF